MLKCRHSVSFRQYTIVLLFIASLIKWYISSLEVSTCDMSANSFNETMNYSRRLQMAMDVIESADVKSTGTNRGGGPRMSNCGLAVGIVVHKIDQHLKATLDSLLYPRSKLNQFVPQRICYIVQTSNFGSESELQKTRLFLENYTECVADRSMTVVVPAQTFYSLDGNSFSHHVNLSTIEGFLGSVQWPWWVTLTFSSLPGEGHLFHSDTILAFADHVLLNSKANSYFEAIAGYVDVVYGRCIQGGHNYNMCNKLLENSIIPHLPSVFIPSSIDRTKDITTLSHQNYIAAQTRNSGQPFDPYIPVRFEYWPFDEIPVYINSPAIIDTTLDGIGRSCEIQQLYSFTCDYFLTEHVTPGDHITLRFYPPVYLEEYYIRSGHPAHKFSQLSRGTIIEVLSINDNKYIDVDAERSYRTVGRFKGRGLAQGPLGGLQLGKVFIFRIRFTEKLSGPVSIREMVLKTEIVPKDRTRCCEPMWPDPYPDGVTGYN